MFCCRWRTALNMRAKTTSFRKKCKNLRRNLAKALDWAVDSRGSGNRGFENLQAMLSSSEAGETIQ